MIENKTGASVEKGNFFGREKELKIAWRKICDGNSLILAAPRRVGKTSFAKKLQEMAEQEEWDTLFLDLEGVHSEKEFVATFIDKLNAKKGIVARGGQQIIDIIKQVQTTISAGGVDIGLGWKDQRADVFRNLAHLIEEMGKRQILIVLDELAIFLDYLIGKDKENIENVQFFLNWLRSFRQNRECAHLWIFCSSVSIENFLSIHKLSHTVNDIEPFKLGALSDQEAIELLTALSDSYQISMPDECKKYILQKIGWALPFYIQIIFSEIRDLSCYNDLIKITIENVNEAYEKLLSKQYFNTWEERLKEYTPLNKPMKLILDNLSKVPEGESRDMIKNKMLTLYNDIDEVDEILGSILEILSNDGYIIRNKETNKYQFRSFLLRDFWYNKFIA
ncbi:ATP-binding protein [Bacteroides sp.]|uniref:ATP-binding protein n=1 Tax=Bacteroides sp. TaxID=29523 RepID=UPI00262D2200|nr:ATP-binding protein [Bacteroides sp.]